MSKYIPRPGSIPRNSLKHMSEEEKLVHRRNLSRLRAAKQRRVSPDKVREYNRRAEENNPSYVAGRVAQHKIRHSLKYNADNASFLAIVGCPLAQFKEHMEKQFVDGMTWENRGLYGWHIDHITPRAKFDLTDPEQLAECFHYTNTQPLWAQDNLRKWKH